VATRRGVHGLTDPIAFPALSRFEELRDQVDQLTGAKARAASMDWGRLLKYLWEAIRRLTKFWEDLDPEDRELLVEILGRVAKDPRKVAQLSEEEAEVY
jgi:hypothetical protein